MRLSTGTRIGPFEVLGSLGAGGMGEVYRARDSKLGRQVALKVLPDAYAQDPERLARFRREAQALAALNHPNIGQIYGFEEIGGIHALVLELVGGTTLAEAIASAPANRGLGVHRSLLIARQIVDALDAAHAQGIVHRDLKPVNIKLQVNPDDQSISVKVLDFGLAKALSLDDPSGSANLAHSPTITSPRRRQGSGEAGTAFGVILGTAGYMAPEQAMGAIADKRADIWAFGVVLYEMLSGRRPFQGQDVGTLLTESVTSDPDLSTLPIETPASVRRLIGRCLEKSPRRRLRDIGDARAELDEREIVQGPGAGAATRNERAAARFGPTIAWGLVVVLGIAVAVLAFRLTERPPGQAQPVRFLLDGPDGTPFFGYFALSHDGRRVAFNPGPHTPESGFATSTRWSSRRCRTPRVLAVSSGPPTAGPLGISRTARSGPSTP